MRSGSRSRPSLPLTIWNGELRDGSHTGAGSESGRFSGSGRRAKRIRLPMRRADTSYVGASEQLDKSGRITVSIYSRRR
jgi:hypothetical protein